MSIITLPRSAIKELSDKYVKIEFNEDEIPYKTIDKKNIQQAFGILNEMKMDPMKFQRKLRSEWDRV